MSVFMRGYDYHGASDTVTIPRIGLSLLILAGLCAAAVCAAGGWWIFFIAIAIVVFIPGGVLLKLKIKNSAATPDEIGVSPEQLEGYQGIVTITIMPQQWGEVAVHINGRTYTSRARGTNPEDTIQDGETVIIDMVRAGEWIVKRRVGGAR